MKFKYSPSAIKRADRQIKELLQEVIKTKKGGTTKKGEKSGQRVLNEKSKDLKNNIKPIIKVDKRTGEIEIDIEVMKYYQYLDEGTERIKYPWFLTDEIMRRTEFVEAIQELIASGFKETIVDILSIKV